MKKVSKRLLAMLCSAICLFSCSGLALAVFGALDDGAGNFSGGQSQLSYGFSSREPLFSPYRTEAVFYNVTIRQADGSGEGPFTAGEAVEVQMDFQADSLQPGDKIVITLPYELNLIWSPDFSLQNAANVPIATASIDTSTNSITVEFNDRVAGLGNITGQLTYTASIARVKEGPYQLQFRENDRDTLVTRLEIVEGATVDYDKAVHKWGTRQGDGSIQWTVYLNFDRIRRSGATVEDEIGDGLAVVDGSVAIYRCDNLSVSGNNVSFQETDVTGEFAVEYTGKGFRFAFPETEAGYMVVYSTIITDASVKNYQNKAILTNGDGSWSFWWNSVYWNYGGNAQGDYSGALKLIKRDAETKEPLPDAHFLLLDGEENIVAQLVTDSSGSATAGELEVGATYYLVETQPPSGYRTDSGKITAFITGGEEVEVAAFNHRIDAVPDPAPQPDPEPSPDPSPDPEPSPGPDPIPSPDPDPVPSPDPDPVPDPVPGPEPTAPPDSASPPQSKSGGTSGKGDRPDTDPKSVDSASTAEETATDAAHIPGDPPEEAATQNPQTGRASAVLLMGVALVSLGGAVLLFRFSKE